MVKKINDKKNGTNIKTHKGLDSKRIDKALVAYELYCLRNLMRPEIRKGTAHVETASLDLMKVLETNPTLYKAQLKELEVFQHIFPSSSDLRRFPGEFEATIENFQAHKIFVPMLKYATKEEYKNLIDSLIKNRAVPTAEEYAKKYPEGQLVYLKQKEQTGRPSRKQKLNTATAV